MNESLMQRPPAVWRLTLVELRKFVDTPSGFVICAVSAVLAGLFGGGAVLYRQPTSIGDIAMLAGVPAGTLVPVLAILLVTAERTHRTALTTYTLTPRRHRVLLAKAGAAGAVALAVTPLALVAAGTIGPVGALVTGQTPAWSVDAGALGRFTLVNVVLALTGYALALAIGNAPTSIVIMLVWPMVMGVVRTASPSAGEVVRWLEMAAVGEDPGRTGASLALWVGLPALVGFRRVLRAEVR